MLFILFCIFRLSMEALIEAGEYLNLAVLQNDTDKLKQLISQGHNINSVGSLTRRTPLHHACTRGWTEIIDLLLDYSADVNINTSDNQGTPLHMACDSGRLDVVKKLTSVEDCNLNISMVYNHTPLMVAARKGRYPIVKHLVSQKKCELNSASVSGRTALMAASEEGHVEVVRTLVEAGCKPDQKDGRGRTAMQYSVFARQLSVLKELIRCGADINLGDTKRNTPLHLAASKGYLDIISCLGEAGADVYATNKSDDAPLNVAIKEGFPKVVERLLYIGTNPNRLLNSPVISVFTGSCPSLANQADMIKVLIKGGIDLTKEIRHSGLVGAYTALQFVLLMGAYDIAKVMLSTEFDFSNEAVWIDNIPNDNLPNSEAMNFFLWYKQETSSAKTLKRCCRKSIRQGLDNTNNWPYCDQVNKLPLPPFLKNFLLLKDVEAVAASTNDDK